MRSNDQRVNNAGLAGSVDRPQDLWLPFKNMFQQLQHVSYRRSVLKLDDASPLLKSLKGKWRRCKLWRALMAVEIEGC